MRFLALLIFVAAINFGDAWRSFMRGRGKNGNLGTPKGNYENLPPEQWFQQILDHFNPVESGTWQQRYYVNAQYYKPGGPAFLMIGGEGPASAKWMVQGQWLEYAKKLNAICFQLEHRYYGKSHPTPDLSVKNLVYLSSEQALADIAYFVEAMTLLEKLPDGTKWIAFGGSYSGSLAAWSRIKYPHLIHGAMSASAPLLAKIDFQEYFTVVENSLKQYSQKCVDTIAEADKQVHAMLRHPLGRKGIAQKFNLCDPIDSGYTTRKDIANFYETLAGNFAEVVQYNKDNRNETTYSIDDICNVLANETIGIAVDRIATVSNMLLKANDEKCFDYKYKKMIEKLRNTTWSNEIEGGRQWTYQTCTEFGFFQSSTAQPNLFSDTFPAEFFIEQCGDIFGPRYPGMLEQAVERTNTLYGGLNLEVTNVVFVHGSIDPWHALGIIKSNNSNTPAIYINGTAHCANVYPPSKNDLPQLVEARKQIGQYIEKWLKS